MQPVYGKGSEKLERIRYRDGYKYQIAETYQHLTDIFGFEIDAEFITLNKTGLLTIKRGYAWNGASGPTIDSKCSMRGSLVHDALYQLMGIDHRLIPFRLYADELLHDICREDGMTAVRSWLWKKAVNIFGESAATAPDEIKEAP